MSDKVWLHDRRDDLVPGTGEYGMCTPWQTWMLLRLAAFPRIEDCVFVAPRSELF